MGDPSGAGLRLRNPISGGGSRIEDFLGWLSQPGMGTASGESQGGAFCLRPKISPPAVGLELAAIRRARRIPRLCRWLRSLCLVTGRKNQVDSGFGLEPVCRRPSRDIGAPPFSTASKALALHSTGGTLRKIRGGVPHLVGCRRLPRPLKTMKDHNLEKAVSWAEGILSTRILQGSRLSGGRNNRVYQLDSPKGAFVLKVYFRHPGDCRNRRKAEFQFVSFLWKKGFRQIPRPVASCPRRSASLFCLLPGKKPGRGGIGPMEIGALARFLVFCWKSSRRLSPSSFSSASEACFSIREFEGILKERIRHVARAGDKALRSLVLREIQPTLSACLDHAGALAGTKRLSRTLPLARRTLSPADHGFQNCLRAGKRVAFVDFEYAGWDDPTTVISNACLHPGIPMPRKYQAEFVRSVMRGIGAGREEWLRLRLIYPLQALKWALILLNPLLSVGQARRKFAGGRSARFSRDKIISHVRLHVRLARRALEPEYWLPYSGSGAYTV